MDALFAIVVAGIVWSAATFASGAASRLLRRRVIDRPNARSTHRVPTPRGGGIGFIPVILLGLVLVAAVVPLGLRFPAFTAGIIGAIFVAAVSFADDLRPLSGRLRLAVQVAAVALVLATWPPGAIVADGMPILVDRLIVGIAWVWFMNLFNFMDGIDGIAASEAGVVSAGIFAVAIAASPSLSIPAFPAVVVGAGALGFLAVNWPPASVFMGDVGSVSLGFLLGWVLLAVADAGFLAAAIILPFVFLLDATSTLILRLVRGAPLAQAHRDHAYQAAVDRGVPAAFVTSSIIIAGLVLGVFAVWSVTAPAPALAGAAGATLVFVLALRFGWPPFQRRPGAGGETASRSR